MTSQQTDKLSPEEANSVAPASESQPSEPQGTGEAVEASPEPKKSRAGRDLPAAILVGVSLGALAILSLVYWHPGIALMAIAASTFGSVELHKALAKAGLRISLPICLVGGLAMQAVAWIWGVNALLMAYSIVVIMALIWHSVAPEPTTDNADNQSVQVSRARLANAAATVTALTYLPFLASIAVMMAVYGQNVWLLTIYISATVAADTFGYLFGVTMGKHPVAPSISPKKSWEGFIGSIFGSLVISFIFGPWAGMNWWQCLITGLAIAVTSLVGDLIESLIKRDLGIKDMGSILPGHGGVLDRFDALLVVAPVCAVLGIVFLGGW